MIYTAVSEHAKHIFEDVELDNGQQSILKSIVLTTCVQA